MRGLNIDANLTCPLLTLRSSTLARCGHFNDWLIACRVYLVEDVRYTCNSTVEEFFITIPS